MRINSKFNPLVLEFDDEDKKQMKELGLDQYFQELKEKEIFDLNACVYYNGPAFFIFDYNEIVCYECTKNNISDWYDEIECLTFNLEDIEKSVICEHCGKLVPSAYGDDE